MLTAAREGWPRPGPDPPSPELTLPHRHRHDDASLDGRRSAYETETWPGYQWDGPRRLAGRGSAPEGEGIGARPGGVESDRHDSPPRGIEMDQVVQAGR